MCVCVCTAWTYWTYTVLYCTYVLRAVCMSAEYVQTGLTVISRALHPVPSPPHPPPPCQHDPAVWLAGAQGQVLWVRECHFNNISAIRTLHRSPQRRASSAERREQPVTNESACTPHPSFLLLCASLFPSFFSSVFLAHTIMLYTSWIDATLTT